MPGISSAVSTATTPGGRATASRSSVAMRPRGDRRHSRARAWTVPSGSRHVVDIDGAALDMLRGAVVGEGLADDSAVAGLATATCRQVQRRRHRRLPTGR